METYQLPEEPPPPKLPPPPENPDEEEEEREDEENPEEVEEERTPLVRMRTRANRVCASEVRLNKIVAIGKQIRCRSTTTIEPHGPMMTNGNTRKKGMRNTPSAH